ncbi:ribonuclease domain-containing protein [Gordonia paraffinivorans]|uniref:ribonuclease domain-containing protein n=1 Tax=Gordonia paraffinivorans TaxID=175628 RepID=UPI001E4544AA|nr:ribonuclease domain-containing protein [Gordonia paraffinivorans]MCD2145311.1 ribonuclease N [Gordonia paraffinivorans]
MAPNPKQPGPKQSVAQRKRQALITATAFVLIAVVFGVTWLINNSGGKSDETHTVAVSTSTSTTKAASSKIASSKIASKTSKVPSSKVPSSKKAATHTTTPKPATSKPTTPKTSTARSSAANAAIPPHVLRTLAYIDAGEWPEAANAPGTKGGVTFRNNEGLLPRTDSGGRRITYREWDVNPKAPNRGRDAERIVTGSDGSAWYTADHYRTFVKIRGSS